MPESGQLDPELWRYGMTLLSAIFGVLIISAATVASIYFKNTDSSSETNDFFKSQSATRLLTVLVVVSAACVLSLFHALNDGAIAILSGITGYVLGGLPAQKSPDSDKQDKTKDKDSDPHVKE